MKHYPPPPPHIPRTNSLGFYSRFLVTLAFITGLSIVASGCAAPLLTPVIQGALSVGKASGEQAKKDANKKPELTQLQTRELQTRSYETEDTTKVLQIALAVLQDDGFVVQNANTDIGLLSASKSLHEVGVDDMETAFAKGFFGLGSVTSQEFSTVQSTVTVTPFGKKTRVRLSVRLSSTEIGGLSGANVKYESVTDPEFYQEFFTKLEKGIFIEQQQL